jgi:hypothetical protein
MCSMSSRYEFLFLLSVLGARTIRMSHYKLRSPLSCQFWARGQCSFLITNYVPLSLVSQGREYNACVSLQTTFPCLSSVLGARTMLVCHYKLRSPFYCQSWARVQCMYLNGNYIEYYLLPYDLTVCYYIHYRPNCTSYRVIILLSSYVPGDYFMSSTYGAFLHSNIFVSLYYFHRHFFLRCASLPSNSSFVLYSLINGPLPNK